MSHSIHVATKGQNDYSGYWGAFDHEGEGINTLIQELCKSAIFDDEDPVYATEICVERRELLRAADTIELPTTIILYLQSGSCHSLLKSLHGKCANGLSSPTSPMTAFILRGFKQIISYIFVYLIIFHYLCISN